MRPARRPSARGLTLFEVTISIALIGMLLAALMTFFWQSAEIRSRASKNAARARIIRLVLSRIAGELQNTVGMERTGFQSAQQFVGDRRKITFLTTPLPQPASYAFFRESERGPAPRHDLIEVTYELLPPVLNVQQAMRDDAPILLPELRTDEMGDKGNQPTNIASHSQSKHGDVEQGFREAAVIVEREFVTSTVHQGYIEPQNATAQYNADGQLTIWCSTQAAFIVRDQLADILHMPVSKIRVIPMEIGGGFGGKISVYLEPIAALLSRKSGHRPVKLTMSYGEVLAATGPASGSYIQVKMGADQRSLKNGL